MLFVLCLEIVFVTYDYSLIQIVRTQFFDGGETIAEDMSIDDYMHILHTVKINWVLECGVDNLCFIGIIIVLCHHQ